MPDSMDTDAPIVIEAWLGDSPKHEDSDDYEVPGWSIPLERAVESFNRAHPEYLVRLRKIDFRVLPEAVAEAAARGNPPDLAEYVYTATQVALDTRDRAGDPLFVPVQRAIGDRTHVLGEPVVVGDLVPAVRDYWSRGGELVSMPTVATKNLLYADRAVLERAGVERMPATWQELTAACAAIAELPDGPPHGVAWPNYGWLFHTEVAEQGGLLGNNGNGRSGRSTRVFLDSPEMLEYVRWWKDMHDRGYYHYTGERNDYFGCMEAFARHEVAFVVTSSAVGQDMTGMAAEAGIELAVNRLPRRDAESPSGGPFGGQSFFLTAGLPKEKEDGALAFLQHQLNPRHSVARMRDRSLPLTLPACERAAADDPEPYPGLRAATAQLESSHRSPAAAGPLLGDLNGVNGVLTAAMEDVLIRDADPAGRFRAATEEAQALLDRYNAAALAYPPVTPDSLTVTA